MVLQLLTIVGKISGTHGEPSCEQDNVEWKIASCVSIDSLPCAFSARASADAVKELEPFKLLQSQFPTAYVLSMSGIFSIPWDRHNRHYFASWAPITKIMCYVVVRDDSNIQSRRDIVHSPPEHGSPSRFESFLSSCLVFYMLLIYILHLRTSPIDKMVNPSAFNLDS